MEETGKASKSAAGHWVCPRCGTPTDRTFCGQCGFRIIPAFDKRLVAYLIDSFILWVFSFLFRHITLDPPAASSALECFRSLFFFVYLMLFTRVWGQTFGKMLMGIKVVRTDGSPLIWLDVGLRYAPEILLSSLWSTVVMLRGPYGLLVLILLVSLIYLACDVWVTLKNVGYRAIHNLISGTVVVNDPAVKKVQENV